MRKTLEIILIVVTTGSVLAFGGVQPIAYTLMELTLFAAFILLMWHQARDPKETVGIPLWPLLFLAVVFFSIVPLPPHLVSTLSPARLANPAAAALGLGQEARLTLSIYPHATMIGIVKIAAYLCAFLVAAYLFDSEKRSSNLLLALVFLGCFEAAYGIVQDLTGWQKIFTYTKEAYRESASGTYINHNHFAGFLELTLPIAVAMVFYLYQLWTDSRSRQGASRAVRGGAEAGPRALFYLFFALVMVMGVVLSRSRGGVLATLLSLLFIAVLAQLKIRRKTWLMGVALFLFVVVGYALWIGLNPVLQRFELLRQAGYLQGEGRLSTWEGGLRLVRDYPVWGTGLNTFGLAFRHYQTSWVNFFFDHAHNDYLEFATDTGLVGVLLLFLPIFYVLVKMILSFLRDQRRYRSAVTLGCIGATLAMLIHTAMDFNLQIPANALVFAMVLGIGYKSACLEPRN